MQSTVLHLQAEVLLHCRNVAAIIVCPAGVSITPGQVVCAQAMNHFESFCGFDDCQRDLVALHLLGCGHMDSAPWNPLLCKTPCVGHVLVLL